MFSSLEKLQKEKYKHEYSAREKILEKIKNPYLKKICKEVDFTKEHRIVVFGRSGVGKTTLILKLLGAKSKSADPENNIVKLGKYIRGNKQSGGAGTATVFRYSVSETNTGIIHYPDGKKLEFKNLEVLRKSLKKIRKKVETDDWSSKKPVELFLPRKFFIDLDDVPWVITDLPGIKSNSKQEHKHVSELVKAYVLNSNVLLVVEHSNQIKHLETLLIPDFGSWKYFGKRCCLIVTHAVSEHSVKEKMKKYNSITVEKLKDYYESEIENEGIGLEGINGVYPLEYGESWQNLQSADSKLFDRVSNAMSKIIDDLRSSLQKSLKPDEAFKSLNDIEVFSKRIEEKIQEKKKRIKKIKTKNKEIKRKQKNITKKLNNKNQKLELEKQKKEKWEQKKTESFPDVWSEYESDIENYDQDSPAGHDKYWEKERQKFRNLIESYSKQIFGEKNGYELDKILSENVSDRYPPFSISWREFADKKYKSYDKINYNKLFFWEKKKPKRNHSCAVCVGLKKLFEFWRVKIDTVVSQKIDSKITKIKRENIYKLEKTLKIHEDELNKYGEIIIDKKKCIVSLEREIEELEETIDDDLQLFGEPYRKIRHQELHKRTTEIWSKINSSGDPIEIIQLMAYIYQIKKLSRSMN